MTTTTHQYALYVEAKHDQSAWLLGTDDAKGELHVLASDRIDEPIGPTVRRQLLTRVIDYFADGIASGSIDQTRDHIQLFVFDTETRRLLLEFGEIFGPVQVIMRSEMTREDWWSGAGRRMTKDLLGINDEHQTKTDTPRLRPIDRIVEAATDGSVLWGKYKGASYAWARADGRYGYNTVQTTDILYAELTAIYKLIIASDKGERLLVHVDSKVALRLLDEGPQIYTPSRITKLVRKIESASGKLASIRFQWVKAHQGHALNDAADRLARLARQTKGLPSSARVTIARNIMRDVLGEQPLLEECA